MILHPPAEGLCTQLLNSWPSRPLLFKQSQPPPERDLAQRSKRGSTATLIATRPAPFKALHDDCIGDTTYPELVLAASTRRRPCSYGACPFRLSALPSDRLEPG